jgi:hypothetical protein
VQFLRGAGEAELPCDGFEYLQLAKGDVHGQAGIGVP